MPDGARSETQGGTDVEMVAVARIWAQERIDQFRDERDSIKNWAYRMYRDLHEIVEFDSLEREGAD
jgi:hypothetical protein